MNIALVFVLIASILAVFSDQSKSQNDGVSATTNVPGADYPKIHSDGSITFRINAPDARKVQLQLDKQYDMVRDENGVWSITTPPQVPGFHYYSLIIDGVWVCDPASETFFGMGRDASGIEVPENGVDFYDPQDVPHGEIRMNWYFSETTKAWRRIFVYTPPNYDVNLETHYPVLYLQHGGGEDERGWVNQGRVNFIMDNLIAKKQAKPMIIVMENGIAKKAGESPEAHSLGNGDRRPNWKEFTLAFEEVVINDLIPMIDNRYRTIPDRDHRAMAGLSMGGMQTFQITMNHLDKFAYIGGFSGAGGGFGPPGAQPLDISNSYNGVFRDADGFNRKVRLLWVGVGTEEPARMYDGIKAFHDALEKAGIKHVYYESPGTSHEWLTWRRDLKEFAPLLFNVD